MNKLSVHKKFFIVCIKFLVVYVLSEYAMTHMKGAQRSRTKVILFCIVVESKARVKSIRIPNLHVLNLLPSSKPTEVFDRET